MAGCGAPPGMSTVSVQVDSHTVAHTRPASTHTNSAMSSEKRNAPPMERMYTFSTCAEMRPAGRAPRALDAGAAR